MKRFFSGVYILFLVLALAGTTNASVFSLVGDKDGFGIPGAPAVPSDGSTFTGIGGTWFTDYRDAGDLATAPFTDVYDNTLNLLGSGALVSPISYTHTYTIDGTPLSAMLYIQEAAMSDARGPWDVSFDGNSIGSIGVFDASEDPIRLLSFSVPIGLLTGADIITLTYLDPDPLSNQDGFAINFSELDVTTSAVPEPSTMLLLGAGLAGVGLFRKRFRS